MYLLQLLYTRIAVGLWISSRQLQRQLNASNATTYSGITRRSSSRNRHHNETRVSKQHLIVLTVKIKVPKRISHVTINLCFWELQNDKKCSSNEAESFTTQSLSSFHNCQLENWHFCVVKL